MVRIRVGPKGLAVRAAVSAPVPRLVNGAAPLLRLQTLVGNRAVSQTLAGRILQRCGTASTCHCPPDERVVRESAMAAAVQRETKADPTAAAPAAADTVDQASTAGPQPYFGPALQLPEEQARSFINECCDVLGASATRVVRWPDASAAITGTSPGQVDTPIQTTPVEALLQRSLTLQRAGSGSAINIEFGVVGSIQVCYDFCTGDLEVSGWVWAGIGTHLPIAGWVGPYYFQEGHFGKTNIGGLLRCGICADNCAERGGSHGGWGIAGFPVHLTPGRWARFNKAGVEFGVLLTPRSRCDADVEAIILLNLLGYLGPAGAAITRFVEGINQAGARYGVNVMLEFGVQGNGGGHLCRSASGGMTADHLSLCGGGYIGGGIGLSRDKNALPH
jgi:hypothetical protein